MLRLNINRVFALRGVQDPFPHMVKIGISRPTAWNLLNNRVSSIQNKHLEKLCTYLNCSPTDLYEWLPDKDTLDVESHPLRALRRESGVPEYQKMLRDIPLDKIDRVKDAFAELTSEA